MNKINGRSVISVDKYVQYSSGAKISEKKIIDIFYSQYCNC